MISWRSGGFQRSKCEQLSINYKNENFQVHLNNKISIATESREVLLSNNNNNNNYISNSNNNCISLSEQSFLSSKYSACTKSFASLLFCVVGLYTSPRNLCHKALTFRFEHALRNLQILRGRSRDKQVKTGLNELVSSYASIFFFTGFLVSKETVVLRRWECETEIWFFQTS